MPRMHAMLALAALAVAPLACGDTFTCIDDASCGDSGRCEPNGHCSFPADDCPSGRRYGTHAPAALAGECVDDSIAQGSSTGGDTTTTTTLTTTDVTDPSSPTATTEPMTSTIDLTTSTSDPTATSDATSTTESTTGGQRIELGPLVIEHDLDDGSMWPTEMRPGAWNPSGEVQAGQAFMGEHPTGREYFGYFRFQLPMALPPGTIVVSSHFEVGGFGVYLWSNRVHALRVYVERSRDAPQVTSLDAYPGEGLETSVALVQASTRWPEMGGLLWDILGVNASPQLVEPLQQLLDADDEGLEEGAHVQLWIGADDPGGGTHEVGWVDRSGNRADVGTLWLEVMLP